MITKNFDEAFDIEWIEKNVANQNHELVILREIIPWERIIERLACFYDKEKGPVGKSLRMMIALLIILRFYLLSDRTVVKQVKENRYIQYFCNVRDEGLQTFLHPSLLCVFRKRIGEKGMEIIEEEIFQVLRYSGAIQSDSALIDTTVLNSNIIFPNDVQLIFKAFKKMRHFAKLFHIPIWWDDKLAKKLWREFGAKKGEQRSAYLLKFNQIFVPALAAFHEKVESFAPGRQKNKARTMLTLLELLEEQTLQKLSGEKQIKNRIVSLDDPDARPIKKGKIYPECEFGSTIQTVFNREGYLIVVENYIGNPNDKTLYPSAVELYVKRMKDNPDTVIADLGYRSRSNFNDTPKGINHIFLGRSNDVTEEKREYCQKARSATEGFNAVAKNLRGFGKSLWHRTGGHRMWSLLCQAAYNLKKFLLQYYAEKIDESTLVKLGLA